MVFPKSCTCLPTGNFIFSNTTKNVVHLCVTSTTHIEKLLSQAIQKVQKIIYSQMKGIIQDILRKCPIFTQTFCKLFYQTFKTLIWSLNVTSATWNYPSVGLVVISLSPLIILSISLSTSPLLSTIIIYWQICQCYS